MAQKPAWEQVIAYLLLIHVTDEALANQLRRVAMDESLQTIMANAANWQAWKEIVRRHYAGRVAKRALDIFREIQGNLKNKNVKHPYYSVWRRRINWLLTASRPQ